MEHLAPRSPHFNVAFLKLLNTSTPSWQDPTSLYCVLVFILNPIRQLICTSRIPFPFLGFLFSTHPSPLTSANTCRILPPYTLFWFLFSAHPPSRQLAHAGFYLPLRFSGFYSHSFSLRELTHAGSYLCRILSSFTLLWFLFSIHPTHSRQLTYAGSYVP
jgi:hypothetical protein